METTTNVTELDTQGLGSGNVTLPPMPPIKDDLAEKLQAWLVPPLFTSCVFGNVLIVIVMSKPSNRRLTSASYFTALAISDTIFIAQRPFLDWIEVVFGVDIFGQLDKKLVFIIHKKLLTFINNEVSAWLLVAVTVDRLIVISFPHRSRHLCSVFKARVVIATIVIFFTGLNCFLTLYCVDIRFDDMAPMPRIVDAVPHGATIALWVDMSFMFIIPFIINSIGTVIIIVQLKRSQKLRRRSTGGSISSKTSSVRMSPNMSATLNLIAANVTFLITVSPMNTLLLIVYLASLSLESINTLRVTFQIIFLMNSVLNFYVYILSGTRFRQDVKSVLCRRKVVEDKTSTRTISVIATQSSIRTPGADKF